ncbi:hypothetical protein MRB53_001176 [Persea americana]|uniref:Uncharacterized protein n=1 Tax=Persea americana TaxID=3435 RepID=A0ACC2MRM6_PERAE|nr:hypothetical protein MRB53_001176 [Persea americana]
MMGSRFCPTDGELIRYLWLKNSGLLLPSDQIKECNVYACNPDQLPREFNYGMGNELYFFTKRGRKYFRPSRTAGDGFWKATGAEQVIQGSNKSIIGLKKNLVFHYKENNIKTNWQMHEYRIEKTDGASIGKESLKMDGFVICRIYEQKIKASKPDTLEDDLFNIFYFDTHAPISSSQSAGDAIDVIAARICNGSMRL